MCWADRLGVLWAAIVFLSLFVIASDRTALFTPGVLRDLAIIVVPVWLLLRLIDWVTGGPARRRGQVRARVIR